MTRKKIGLALSGGGARGLAHVGVIKVLAEHNIPIDMIAGTSIGSLIGGAFASGLTPDEIEKMSHGIRWRHLTQPSYSPIALLSNKRMGQFIERRFPITKFEELKIPLSVVACDLKKSERVVFKDSGDLVMAIRASCAVPGFFSPVKYDGRTLVDGGVMDPLPVDAVKEMGADVVIAVDLLGCGTEYLGVPKTALGMIFKSAFILLRTATKGQQHDADITLLPRIAHIRPDRLNQNEACRLRGEEIARENIEEIKRLVSG